MESAARAKGRRAEVTCVGLTTLDILGRPIDSVPSSGGGVQFIDELRLTVAGTAGGTAVDCAKLGLDTRLVAALADDEAGRFVKLLLDRYGVDSGLVQTVERGVAATSSTILTINSKGERPAFHKRGSSDVLVVQDSDLDRVCNTKYLHMGGTGLLNAMDGEPTLRLLKHAKSVGCIVTFDLIAPNEKTLDLIAPCLPFVDFFMPSMEEAIAISGKTDPEEVARFFEDLGAATCIFKWGSNGSFVHSRKLGLNQRIPAFQVEVVDTTGCGDAYCAGFIAGLSSGMQVIKACRFGTAASALVATGLGSDAGIIDLADTKMRMETIPQRSTTS